MGEHAAASRLTSPSGKTSSTHDSKFLLRLFDASTYNDVLGVTEELYRRVYGEPPYNEGPEDVADFVRSLPRRASQVGFKLVVATINNHPIGFAFGHQLPPDTKWWAGATTSIPESATREYPGRTFALIELAVLPEYRRQGIAAAMHNELRARLSEERMTLLVRPEAKPAIAAYRRWGYASVGSVKPFQGGPEYTAMVLPLGGA